MHFRAVGDKGQSEFEESLRKLFQALVQLMADVKKDTLLTQVTSSFTESRKAHLRFLRVSMHYRKMVYWPNNHSEITTLLLNRRIRFEETKIDPKRTLIVKLEKYN